MTTRKVTTKGGAKGKVTAPRTLTHDEMRAQDEATAARILAILSDPNTGERVTLKLQKLVSQLGELTHTDTLETPGFYAEAFAAVAPVVREGGADAETLTAFAQAMLYAEKHEPKEYKLARRCAEIYAAAEGDGAFYFVEHVDAVLEGGDDGLMPNPDSKYFAPLFVESMRERGPRDRRVRALLDLIRRVDEGADLGQLHAEAERAAEARRAGHEPKDARLVRLLLDRAYPTDADREAAGRSSFKTGGIIDHATTLADELNVTIFHPDVFPHALPVIIRAARTVKGRGQRAQGLRSFLRALEEAATPKGGGQ